MNVDIDRIKDLGEVFTPEHTVDEMLDQLPAEAWSDPNRTWLEPSCGDGNIIVRIVERLMVGLEEWEANSKVRFVHIIENMIYGVDIMQDNVDACVERLKIAELHHNIVKADGLRYEYTFGREIEISEGLTLTPEDDDKAEAREAFLNLGKKTKSKKAPPVALDDGLFG